MMDYAPRPNRHGSSRHVAAALTLAVVILVVAVALRILAMQLGASGLGRVIWFVAFGLAGGLVGTSIGIAILDAHRKRAGAALPSAGYGIGFWSRAAHNWRAPGEDEAAAAWRNARDFAATGSRLSVRLCLDCPLVVMECRDASGRSWTLIARVESQPSPEWFAGIFLLRTRIAGSPVEQRRVRLFHRVECRLQPMSSEDARTEWLTVSGAEAATAVYGWRCGDCGTLRLDTTTLDGANLIASTGGEGVIEEFHIAGFYGARMCTPLFPSDRHLDQAA